MELAGRGVGVWNDGGGADLRADAEAQVAAGKRKVSMTDRNGKPIRRLAADQFRVNEAQGVRQEQVAHPGAFVRLVIEDAQGRVGATEFAAEVKQ